MAKKRAGRKSRAIEEYFSENPQAGPKEVVDALKKRRIRVSTQLVNNVKAKLGLTGGRKRATKKKRPRGTPGTISVDQLREAKQLADQLGGVEEARAALQALEELSEA